MSLPSAPPQVATGVVRPTIKVAPFGVLNPMVEPKLVRCVVDLSTIRPDMFELTFLDREGTVLDVAMVDIGTEITVSVGSGPSATDLVVGEVTSIEGDFDQLVHYTVVRGYEHAHRLQRARRTRTFLDSTDGEIARSIAGDADLDVGDVQDPGVTHRYVAQVAQTDWEFLRGRAGELGYEVGVRDGEFYFRPAPGMSAGGLGGALTSMASSAASALGIGGTTLTFGENLRWLRPRISAAGLVAETEVRIWDPAAVEVVSATASLASETAAVDDEPTDLAAAFEGGGLLGALTASIPGLPSFGDAPSAKAYAVVDRPLAWGSVTQSAADAVAAGMAEHVASTFAEAEGGTIATPGVVPGAKVTLANVPSRFAGDWYVTAAQHVFEDAEGYHVRFEVSGRHDRSLHGLVDGGGGALRRERGLIEGLVPGIVTDNLDDESMHRVKVALPWLAPDFQTDWARVVMPGLGETYGFVAVPEVGDEVLVGFEFGDVRRPYVLGGLANGNTDLDLGGDVVESGLLGGSVVKRGWVSRLGHKVLIDDGGDTAAMASPSGITIGNEDDTITIQLDDANKKLVIHCESSTKPASIEISQSGAGGSITIEQSGQGGSLTLTSAGDLKVEAAAPGRLSLSGGAGVKIDGGTGMVELSGSMVKLN